MTIRAMMVSLSLASIRFWTSHWMIDKMRWLKCHMTPPWYNQKRVPFVCVLFFNYSLLLMHSCARILWLFVCIDWAEINTKHETSNRSCSAHMTVVAILIPRLPPPSEISRKHCIEVLFTNQPCPQMISGIFTPPSTGNYNVTRSLLTNSGKTSYS